MKQGFSLVELSIVLAIIGLLTGGILGGQALIRAAELRAVSTESSRYLTAVQTFREKYLAYPGDFSKATKFWGRLNNNADCASNYGTAASTTGTCDGNGDGFIAGAPNNNAGTSAEMFQFWRQLSSAGLIEGSYTGLNGPGGTTSTSGVIGVNVPRSRLSQAGWGARILADYGGDGTTYSGDTVTYAGNYDNILTFGKQSTAGDLPNEPILKPEEAWNIDTKMDDGMPGTGNIKARYWNNACATSTSNTDYSGTYNLSDSNIECAFYFPASY